MRKRVASACLLASSPSSASRWATTSITSQKHATSSSFTSSSSDFLPSVDTEETPPLLRRVVNSPRVQVRRGGGGGVSINSSNMVVGGNRSGGNTVSGPPPTGEEDSFFFADDFSPSLVASSSTNAINDNVNDCNRVLGEDESTPRPSSSHLHLGSGEDIYLSQNTGGPSSSSPSYSTKFTTERGASPRGATLSSSTSSPLFLSTEALTIRSFITAGSATAVRESTQRLLQLSLSLQYRVHRCLPPELENTSEDYRELLGLPLSYSVGHGGVGRVVSVEREERRSTATNTNANTRHHMKNNFGTHEDDGHTIMTEGMCSDANKLHESVVAKVVRGDSSAGVSVGGEGLGTVSPQATPKISVWEAIFIACEMHHARHGQYLEAVMLAASETMSLSNAPTTVTATAAEVTVHNCSGGNNNTIMDVDNVNDRTTEGASSSLFSSSARSQSRPVSSSTNSRGNGQMNDNENIKETNINNNKSQPQSHLRVPYLHSVAIKLFRCLRYYRSRQSHTASTIASSLTAASSTTTTTIDDDAFYGRCACHVLSILASLSSSPSALTTTTTVNSRDSGLMRNSGDSSSSSSLVAWSFLIYDVLQETPHVVSALERDDGNGDGNNNNNNRVVVLEGGVLVTTTSAEDKKADTSKPSSSRQPLAADPPLIPTFSFARKQGEKDAIEAGTTRKVGVGEEEKAHGERSGGVLLPPLTPSQALVVFMARLVDDTVDEFLLLANKGGGKGGSGKQQTPPHHSNDKVHHGLSRQTGRNHRHDFILCSVSSSYSLLNAKGGQQRGEVEGEDSMLRHGADKKYKKSSEIPTTELAPRSSVVDVRYERGTNRSSGAEMDVNSITTPKGHAKEATIGTNNMTERMAVGGGGGLLPSILNTVLQSQAKMSSSFAGSSASTVTGGGAGIGGGGGTKKKDALLRWRGSDQQRRSPILIETLIGTVASMCLSEQTLTVLLITSSTTRTTATATSSSVRVITTTSTTDQNSTDANSGGGGAYFSAPFSSSAAMATVSGPQAALILLEEVLLNLRFSSSSSSASSHNRMGGTAATAAGFPPTTLPQEQQRRPFFTSLFTSSSSSTVGDSSDSPAFGSIACNKTTPLSILHAAAQAAAEREKAEALRAGLMMTAADDGACTPQTAQPSTVANQQHQQLPSNTCILPPAVLTLLDTYFTPVASRLLLIDHTRSGSSGASSSTNVRGSTSSSSFSSSSSDYELLTRLVFLLYRAFGSIAAHSNSVADSASAMLLAVAMRSLAANATVTCATTSSTVGANSAGEGGSTSAAGEGEKKEGMCRSHLRANFPFVASSSLTSSASSIDSSVFKRSLPRCGQSVELYLRIKDGVPLLPTRALLAKESLRAVLSEVRARSVLEREMARSLRQQEEVVEDRGEGLERKRNGGRANDKRKRLTTTITMSVDDDLRLASLRRSFATHSEDVSKIIQLILDDFSSSSSSAVVSSSSTASRQTTPPSAVVLDLLATATAILEELAITTQYIVEAECRAVVEDVVGGTITDANNNNNNGLFYAEARRRLPPMLSGAIPSSSSYPSSSSSSPFPFPTSSSFLFSSSGSIEEAQLWLLHTFSSSLLAFTLSSSSAASAGTARAAGDHHNVDDDDDAAENETTATGIARSFFSSVFSTKTRKSHAETTGGSRLSGEIQQRHGGSAFLYCKDEEDLKRLYVLYCSSAVLFSRYLSLSAATSTPSAASFNDANDIQGQRQRQQENKEELAVVENVLDAVTQELIAAAIIVPYGIADTNRQHQQHQITPPSLFSIRSSFASFACAVRWLVPKWRESVSPPTLPFLPPLPLAHQTQENSTPHAHTIKNNSMKNSDESSPPSHRRRLLLLEFSEACASPHAIFGGNDAGSSKSSSSSSSSKSTPPLLGGRKSIFSVSEVPPDDDQNGLIMLSPAQHLLRLMTEAVLAFTHIHTTTTTTTTRSPTAAAATFNLTTLKNTEVSTVTRTEDQQRRGRVFGLFPCLYPFWPLQDFTVPLLQLIDGTFSAFSFVSHPPDADVASSNASFPSFLPSVALNILTNNSVRTAPPPPLLLFNRSRSLVDQQHSREEEEVPPLHAFHLLQQKVCRQLAEKVLMLSSSRSELLTLTSPSSSTSAFFSWSTLESVALSCCYPAQTVVTAKSMKHTTPLSTTSSAARTTTTTTASTPFPQAATATRRILTVLVELPTVERFLLSFAPPHRVDGFGCSKQALLDEEEKEEMTVFNEIRQNTASSPQTISLSSPGRSRNQIAIEMIKKELAGGRGGEWKKGGPTAGGYANSAKQQQYVNDTSSRHNTNCVRNNNSKNVSSVSMVNALLDEMNQVAFNCCEHVSASTSTSRRRNATAIETGTDVDETEVHFHFTFPAALALPEEVRAALFQQQESEQHAGKHHMMGARPLRTTILPSVDNDEFETRSTNMDSAVRRVPSPFPSSHRPSAAVSLFASVIQPEVPYVRNGRAYGTALAQQQNKESVDDKDDITMDTEKDKKIMEEKNAAKDTEKSAMLLGMSCGSALKEDREIILKTGGPSSSSSFSSSIKPPHTMATEMRSGERSESNNRVVGTAATHSSTSTTRSPMLEAIERLVVQHMSAIMTSKMMDEEARIRNEEKEETVTSSSSINNYDGLQILREEKERTPPRPAAVPVLAYAQGRTLFLWSSTSTTDAPKSDNKEEEPSSEHGSSDNYHEDEARFAAARTFAMLGVSTDGVTNPAEVNTAMEKEKEIQSQQQQQQQQQTANAATVFAPPSPPRHAALLPPRLIVIPIMTFASATHRHLRNHFTPSSSSSSSSSLVSASTTAAAAASTNNTSTSTSDTSTRRSPPFSSFSSSSSSSASVFKTSGFTSRKRHSSASSPSTSSQSRM